jgi:uncharacterized membrane protein
MTETRLSDTPVELPRVALSLAKLSFVGFSLVLFCQMVWLHVTARASFALHNALGVQPRKVLLLAIGAGLVLPVAVAVTVSWLRRQRSDFVQTLERVATLCAPVSLVLFLPGLFLSQVAEAKPLFYLVVLLAVGIVSCVLLSHAISVAPRPSWMPRWQLLTAHYRWRGLPLLLLLVCGAGYAFVLGRYAVAHHRLLQTTAVDLGIVDNFMSNLLYGRFRRALSLYSTVPGGSLSVHADYGALAFVPLYWLRPGAETLIWLQLAFATLTIIPIYLLVAARLSRAMGLWFGVAYLLLAPLHSALLGGFSWLPTVTLLTVTAYYARESHRRWLLLPSLLLLLSISEAGPIDALSLGLFWIVSGKGQRLGAGLCATASALIIFNAVRLSHSAGPHPELASAIETLLGNPVHFLLDLARAAKVTSILHALAPLCALPLFEFAAWPLFIPALLFTVAANEYWPATHLGYGSGLVWIPACVLATLFALEKQRSRARGRSLYPAWIVAITVAQLSHSYNFGALLRAGSFGAQSPSASFRMTPAAEVRYAQLTSLLERIPALASVASSASLFSHVSNRPEAYELNQPYGEPDFILLSSGEVADVRHSLEQSFATHDYRLVASSANDFYLFSRAAENAETGVVLKKLGLREQ